MKYKWKIDVTKCAPFGQKKPKEGDIVFKGDTCTVSSITYSGGGAGGVQFYDTGFYAPTFDSRDIQQVSTNIYRSYIDYALSQNLQDEE